MSIQSIHTIFQSNRTNESSNAITSIIYIAANILYATLSTFPESYRYALMLTSRFVSGVSGGISTSLRSYIAAATFTSERTAQLSMSLSFGSVGTTLGPAISAALTPLQCTDINTQESSQYFSFDMYTSVGWVCVLLGII